jgi:hypothetical protein
MALIIFPDSPLAFEGIIKGQVICKPETCGNTVRRHAVRVISEDRREVLPELFKFQPASAGIPVWPDTAAAGRVQDLAPQVFALRNPGVPTPGGELGIEAQPTDFKGLSHFFSPEYNINSGGFAVKVGGLYIFNFNEKKVANMGDQINRGTPHATARRKEMTIDTNETNEALIGEVRNGEGRGQGPS